MRVLVLYIALAVKKYGKENRVSLSMSYGQKHKKEIKCAEKICKYYGIELYILVLQKIFQYSNCSLLEHSTEEVPKDTYAKQLEKQIHNQLAHMYHLGMDYSLHLQQVLPYQKISILFIMVYIQMMKQVKYTQIVAKHLIMR